MADDWYDRTWAMADDALTVVVESVRTRRPGLVVELGAGRSTLAIAGELRSIGAGRLVSVEHDVAWGGTVRDRLRAAGLVDVATIVVAALCPVELEGRSFDWYDLPAGWVDGPIDLLLVDGPPNPPELGGEARYPALPLLEPSLADGALVIVDDTDRAGEHAMVERWTRERPWWTARRVATGRGLVLLTRGGVPASDA